MKLVDKLLNLIRNQFNSEAVSRAELIGLSSRVNDSIISRIALSSDNRIVRRDGKVVPVILVVRGEEIKWLDNYWHIPYDDSRYESQAEAKERYEELCQSRYRENGWGRGGPNFAVKVRNVPDEPVLFLASSRGDLNASIDSAALAFGFQPSVNDGDGCGYFLSEEFYLGLLPQIFHESGRRWPDDHAKILRPVFDELPDPEHAWGLLEVLNACADSDDKLRCPCMEAILGLPNSEKDQLTIEMLKRQICLMNQMGDILDSLERPAFFARLREELPGNDGIIDCFENHVRNYSSAESVSNSIFRMYAGKARNCYDGKLEVEPWWEIITVSVLERIFTMSDPDKASFKVFATDPVAGSFNDSKQPIVGRCSVKFGFSMDAQDAKVRALRGKTILEDGISIGSRYEYQAGDKDLKSFKISFEAYKDGITSPVRKSHALLLLDTAVAGCFVTTRDPLVLKKAGEFLPTRKNAKSSFASKLSLAKETSVALGIYTGSHFQLEKQSIYANYEGEKTPLHLEAEHYGDFYCVRCDVRDGMSVSFTGTVNGKACSYTVAIEVDQKVDTSFKTVFSHLVECHLNNADIGAPVSFDSSTVSSKISQDHIFAAAADAYYRTGYPLLIADDIGSVNKNLWLNSYEKATKKICVPADPRPDVAAWKAAAQKPEAEAYFASRKAFFSAVSKAADGLGGVVVEEYELFRLSEQDNANLFQLLYEYVAAYANWLEADYQNAVVTDTIWMYLTKENSLGERPDIILLPPQHPVRLYWHFQAQRHMYDLLALGKKSNFVASFDSHAIPDILRMPLLNSTTGKVVETSYFAIPSSSDYWGVYHSYSPKLDVDDLERSPLFDNWGFEVTSLKRTMTAGEVESAIKATQSVCIAKDALNVRYIARNLGGDAARLLLQQGVLFLNGKDDSGPMFGPRLVSIVGPQASNNPEGVTEAEIMSAREHTDDRLQWYTESQGNDAPVKVDVTIASLGASDVAPYSMPQPRSFGVVAAGGLLRYRSRCRGIVSACEVVESRMSYISADVAADDSDNLLLHLLDLLEGEQHFPVTAAGHVHFNADLIGAGILRPSDNSSHYYAISSSDVDQSCFESMRGNEDVYLWEYRLPSPGTHSTGTDGFYLLAKENSTMIQAVSEAVKSLSPEGADSEVVRQMLFLSAKRGIPTVKNLASGGKSAFGEVGVLVTLDMLQGNILDNDMAGNLPAHVVFGGNEFFNILVPMDVFRERFDSVVKDVLGDHNPKRPDIVVFSIKCKSVCGQLTPVRMRLSFIEVKTRREKMSEIDMDSALKQSKCFRELFTVDDSEVPALCKWSRIDFLIGMLTFGFRVYESIPTLLGPLVALYPKVVAALFEKTDFLEVNPLPRLAVIHKIPFSRPSMKADGVYMAIEISKEDAYRIAVGGGAPDSIIDIGFWGLLAEGTMSELSAVPVDRSGSAGQFEALQGDCETMQEDIAIADDPAVHDVAHETESIEIQPVPAVPAGASIDLEEKYANVLQSIKEAFEDFHIDTKRIGQPIETPNFVLIDYKGTPTCTVAKVASKREVFLTTHCVNLHRVEPCVGRVRLVLKREQREILYTDEVWSKYGYNNKAALEKGLLVAIQEDTGEPVYLNPMGGDSAPHTLVAGETGSGKSVLMNNMLYCLRDRFDKGSVEVVIMDPKQVEFMDFADVPGFTVVTDKGKAIEEFKKLVAEMRRRYEIFRKYKCKKISQLSEKPDAEKLPIIWCFHDEFAEWFRDEQYKDSVVNDVNSLGAMARAAGIFLVFATQRPEANIMPPELRSNLGNRLVLKVADPGTSSIALGDAKAFGAANELLGNGHMIMVSGAKKVYCQVPNIKE